MATLGSIFGGRGIWTCNSELPCENYNRSKREIHLRVDQK